MYIVQLFRSLLKYLSTHQWPYLILIFALALGIRLWGEPNFPQCLHRDEVQFGYNAYSILQTARDEWGDFLPLHFKFNGEYHVPVVFYLISLAMAVVGPSDVAIRLPAIVLSSLLCIVGYYFAKELFKDKKVALILSLLLALNPWQIINARASGEISVLSLFFGISGLWGLFVYLRKQKLWILGLALFSLILAYFSYIASRFDIPLLLGLFSVFFFTKIPAKKVFIPLGLVICVLPYLLVLQYPGRFMGTSLIGKHFLGYAEGQIVQQVPTQMPEKVKFYIGKSKDFFFDFVDNYFDYVSPHYIFRDMGEPDRTNIPQTGSLYLIEFIFVIAGLYRVTTLKDPRLKGFLLAWILVTPVVGALTYNYPDRPNSARTVYFYFSLSMLSALGLAYIHSALAKKAWGIMILGGLGIAFTANVAFFARQFQYANVLLSPTRSCGYKEMFTLTESLKSQYSETYIGTVFDYPYVHYLWYSKYPPVKYHQFIETTPPEKSVVMLFAPSKHDWQLDNYVFTHRSCLTDKKPGVLLVANFNECKERYNIRVKKNGDRLLFLLPDKTADGTQSIIYKNIAVIRRPDTTIAFNVYTYDEALDREHILNGEGENGFADFDMPR